MKEQAEKRNKHIVQVLGEVKLVVDIDGDEKKESVDEEKEYV